jgi:ribose transport system ATP-binding protein
LILDDSVKNNVALAGLERYQKNKFVQHADIESVTNEVVKNFSVKLSGISQEVGFLSGGNQQKIALAKWISLKPQVLIVDEPTRGVDVISKAEIYQHLQSIADEGVAVVMVSSDLEEILKVSDRVLVMHEGKISGELKKEDLSEEAVMNLATGRTHE